MKKIIALLAIVVICFSAKAGTVTINNTTSSTFMITGLQIAQFAPPGSFWYAMTGPAIINPGTSITYSSVGDLITAMGGPTTGYGATTHFLHALEIMEMSSGFNTGGIAAGVAGSSCGGKLYHNCYRSIARLYD